MAIPEKEKKRNPSDTRRKRHSTESRTPIPPKFPKPSPRRQAASLPRPVRQRQLISFQPPWRTQNSQSLAPAFSGIDGKMATHPTDSFYFPPLPSTISPSFINNVNGFGLEILSAAIDHDPTKPAGLCPMNIYHCLSMVAAGSQNENLTAFAQVLNFSPDYIRPMIDDVLAVHRYCKSSSAVDFSTGSAIFPARNFILADVWKKLVLEDYEAEIGPLDIAPINAFIERETRGKFKDLIKPDDIDGAVMMLVTCLYFKANWVKAFKRGMTMKNVSFFGYNREVTQCDLMYMCENMEYVEDGKCQVAILPYKSNSQGPKWKAAIILPKQSGYSAMHELIASFTTSPDILRKLLISSGRNGQDSGSRGQPASNTISDERKHKVDLYLPRFSLKLNLDLKPVLSKLGLGPAFAPSDNFAPMSKEGQLYISRATHDMFLEVNEEGTEMAAVTVVTMRRSRPMVQTIQMRVDRPFLFCVFDADQGLILCESVVNLST